MTYEQLPIVEIDVHDLRLDLDNYRIPTHRDDESAALKYLFASEDVLGAAQMILRDGYFDNEIPVVCGDPKSGYIVLEGNRRVSALKALLDPAVVPEHKAEIQRLLTRFALEAEQLPTRIRVMVAESRDQVAPRIARLHTGKSKKAWSLDQQATFYYSLLGTTMTPEDVRIRYAGVAVTRLLKMAAMRRFVSSAKFKDPSLRAWVSGSPAGSNGELKMSSFEYAYKINEIAEAIGVKFDRDGLLEPRSHTPERIGAALAGEQLMALEYLVNEFRAGRLNTRSAALRKGTREHSDLLASLVGKPPLTPELDAAEAGHPKDRQPDGGAASSGGRAPDRAGEAPSGEPTSTSTTGVTPTRGPNHPDTRRALDLTGIEYERTPVNLHSRYQELRKLDVATVPIATSMMMRSVLESTIKWHYEGSPTAVSGTLAEVFKQVTKDYGSDKALRPSVGQIGSGTKPGSVNWFNVIAHDGNAAPTGEDVREAWKLINPILRRLVRPATQPSAST